MKADTNHQSTDRNEVARRVAEKYGLEVSGCFFFERATSGAVRFCSEKISCALVSSEQRVEELEEALREEIRQCAELVGHELKDDTAECRPLCPACRIEAQSALKVNR